MENLSLEYTIPVFRQKAEELLKIKYDGQGDRMSDADKLKLFHELEVHEIELELQNEELQRARTSAVDAAFKYANLYDNAPVSFFTVSREGKILELNTCAANMLGKEKAMLGQSYFASHVVPEMKSAFYIFLEHVFESKTTQSCEISLKRSDESPSVFVILTGILTDQANQCILNALDISERKKATDLTIEKQRLSAIGEMASSVAHDFNNSLQSILGNLELALLGDVSQNTLRYLTTMKTLIADAVIRIGQLQRFGGSGKDAREFSLMNMNNLIEEVIIQTRPLWKEEMETLGRYINIITEFEDIPDILGNEGELRTVLFNIIKNSVEAMPIGGIIRIKTTRDSHNILITISDTGTGMDHETKSRLFQPFYSTKGFNPGRGLGMSSTLSIIKEHRGNISIKASEPGKGTVLEIELPIDNNFSEGSKKVKKEAPQDDKNTKCLRILWVDDDDAIRLYVEELIKMLGHHIDVAIHGKEALLFMETRSYDIVITDIGMPEMNGWQLSDIISEKYQGNPKIAIVSGWGAEIKTKQLKEHGAHYILNKPFNIESLKNFLSCVINEMNDII